MAYETITHNIKMSAKEILGQYELKQNKPWFDEDYSKLLDKRKHAKLQWLQNPSQITGNNLNNVRGKLEELSAKKRGNASKTKLMSLN
jgi:dsDNA-specific endonuclease/ATPase MutS2